MQIADALVHLHVGQQVLHGAVCPRHVLVTKRGIWKLAGLGFVQRRRSNKVELITIKWRDIARAIYMSEFV